jgi:hypothetical protein
MIRAAQMPLLENFEAIPNALPQLPSHLMAGD